MTQHPVSGWKSDYDVAVIGAGAAGLAATQELLSSGKSVVCLEASSRIGGRAWTDTGIFGVPCDLGAHWLHNRSVNDFVEIGQSLGYDLYPAPDHFYAHASAADEAVFEAEFPRLKAAFSNAAAHGKDTALADAFTPANDWSLTAAHMHALSYGRDLDNISLLDWETSEDGEDWFCKQGFGTIVARHARAVPVSLSTAVHGIQQMGGGVRVDTTQGPVRARAAIVTVSQGVLAAGDIRFDPPLSNDMLRAIGAINMGSYNHAIMQFLPDTLPVAADTWVTYQITDANGSTPETGGFLCDIAGTGLTSFEYGASFGRALEQAGEAAALDFALSKLAGIFGADIRKRYLKGHATRWGENRFTKGAYSGATPGASHCRKNLRAPHAERIFLAGEATHLTEQATVSGARKEGLRAAARVLDLLT